jgi:hypothetical protein
MIKCLCLFLLLIMASTVPMPALAEDACSFLPAGTSSENECPLGSVIVIRKFIKGSVVVDNGLVPVPATEIAISVDCLSVPCPDHQQTIIRAHWICPASESSEPTANPTSDRNVIRQTSFKFTVPHNGTAVFTPNGTVIRGSNSVPVHVAPCPKGFLIAYVVNEMGQPISFNALTGHVTLREDGSAVSSLAGVPIPADPDWQTGEPLNCSPDGALIFDGGPGHYAELKSRVRQNFRFASRFADTFITLMTLNVRSNRPNLPTFVPFEFFNQHAQRIEKSTQFVGWTERRLDTIVTFEEMGTRWGLAFSGEAMKIPRAGVSDDAPGPVSLLGLMEVFEGPAAARRTIVFALSPVNSPTTAIFLP